MVIPKYSIAIPVRNYSSIDNETIRLNRYRNYPIDIDSTLFGRVISRWNTLTCIISVKRDFSLAHVNRSLRRGASMVVVRDSRSVSNVRYTRFAIAQSVVARNANARCIRLHVIMYIYTNILYNDVLCNFSTQFLSP